VGDPESILDRSNPDTGAVLDYYPRRRKKGLSFVIWEGRLGGEGEHRKRDPSLDSPERFRPGIWRGESGMREESAGAPVRAKVWRGKKRRKEEC